MPDDPTFRASSRALSLATAQYAASAYKSLILGEIGEIMDIWAANQGHVFWAPAHPVVPSRDRYQMLDEYGLYQITQFLFGRLTSHRDWVAIWIAETIGHEHLPGRRFVPAADINQMLSQGTFSQSKKRATGIWSNGTDSNRLNLRIPHY